MTSILLEMSKNWDLRKMIPGFWHAILIFYFHSTFEYISAIIEFVLEYRRQRKYILESKFRNRIWITKYYD